MLSLGLATIMCVGAAAQDHRGGRHGQDHRGKSHDGKATSKGLAEKVYRVTGADSVQKKKMKPAVDRASKRLETLRASYRKQEQKVMDSLSLQVKPFLKEDQLKKLNDWNAGKGQRGDRAQK